VQLYASVAPGRQQYGCGLVYIPDDFMALFWSIKCNSIVGHSAPTGNVMAKSQKKSNKEIRKPKAEKKKTNASEPSQKSGTVRGLENMKNG